MPRAISNALIQSKNQLLNQSPWVYLVEITYLVNATPVYGHFYLTNYSGIITFNGNQYLPLPISIGNIEENSKGEINRIQIGIANMDTVLTQKLNSHWLNAASPLWQIHIWFADAMQPGETNVAAKETFTVITVSTNLISAVFECLWVGLGFERTLPGRRYTRTGGFSFIPRLVR